MYDQSDSVCAWYSPAWAVAGSGTVVLAVWVGFWKCKWCQLRSYFNLKIMQMCVP